MINDGVKVGMFFIETYPLKTGYFLKTGKSWKRGRSFRV